MDPNIDALLWNGRARDGSGTEKLYGVVPAIVVATFDKQQKRHQMGAVQVRFPWLTDDGTRQDLLPWARCVTFASGHDADGEPCGWVATPQVGDEVLVGFENGDVHRPYVLGALFNPKAKLEAAESEGAAAGTGGAGSKGAAGGASASQEPGAEPEVKDRPVHMLSLAVTARGGTPLVNQRVQVIDQATGEPVGGPVTTDEGGRLFVEVPRAGQYGVRILDDDDDASPTENDEHQDPGEADTTDLYVVVAGPDGRPLAGAAFALSGPASHEGRTDAKGEIEIEGCPPGAYTLRIADQERRVHPILHSDREDDPAPYRIVIDAPAAPAQAPAPAPAQAEG